MTWRLPEDEITLEIMNDPQPKFAFLLSPRFWQLGAVGLSTGLTVYVQSGSWVLGLNAALAAWFIPSVAVGTYDRGQDKKLAATALQYEG